MINIPGGAISRVQPFDVVINKPLKPYVRELFEKHVDENLHPERTLSVAKRQILTIEWTANAWKK